MARITGFPPGASSVQIVVLRKAFDQTMVDSGFLADAKKLKMGLAPLSGATVQKNIANLMKTPKPIMKRTAQVFGYTK